MLPRHLQHHGPRAPFVRRTRSCHMLSFKKDLFSQIWMTGLIVARRSWWRHFIPATSIWNLHVYLEHSQRRIREERFQKIDGIEECGVVWRCACHRARMYKYDEGIAREEPKELYRETGYRVRGRLWDCEGRFLWPVIRSIGRSFLKTAEEAFDVGVEHEDAFEKESLFLPRSCLHPHR
ncbi:uncharacterized protein EI97DRAFT_249437 [Westerdykella ornata]|uniref:Uncharacterized protein n=1 Tax=Westerdykella ornata TaxID=318751 RepID=A0A6A6JNS4_WESOR|nr:uncharacterized protein EI97DRAFT_249437 [Westerdykella ornata]KAF2278271.1 hypothetical protein EI97DRAFT_249437 [Westerdykella ornata]